MSTGELIMKRLTHRSIAAAITLMLTFATVAMSAPKSEQAGKRITIEGRVLEVNRDARTVLVSDVWSKKLYLVSVPKDETFKITFGMYMNTAQPGFQHLRKNDRVRMRCTRADKDHLARLDDQREVMMLTATPY
jgi:hypothetical protein